jgi:hypothetical protein
MEALQAENTLLSKKNITWRDQTAEMEFILPTRALIQPSTRPNYDDLLRGSPNLKPEMECRDEKVRALFKVAQDCWNSLIQSFRHDVEGALKQWREEGNAYPGGAVPEEEFWLRIAELVMNNLEELPYHYASREFWSRFRQQFLAARYRSSFSQLEKAIVELKPSTGQDPVFAKNMTSPQLRSEAEPGAKSDFAGDSRYRTTFRSAVVPFLERTRPPH